MEDILLPVVIVGMLFIGLPWLVFHYVTQWKRSASLSIQDEKLLDELHDLARRLDDRLATIERIMSADDPGWKSRAQSQTQNYRDEPVADREQDWRRQG